MSPIMISTNGSPDPVDAATNFVSIVTPFVRETRGNRPSDPALTQRSANPNSLDRAEPSCLDSRHERWHGLLQIEDVRDGFDEILAHLKEFAWDSEGFSVTQLDESILVDFGPDDPMDASALHSLGMRLGRRVCEIRAGSFPIGQRAVEVAPYNTEED